MEELVWEIEIAFNNGAFLLSLNSALTIPDICAALQSENGQTNKAKYCAWFEKYMPGSYQISLTGEDAYKLRCAALHQGKLNHDDPRYKQIVFQLPDKNRNRFHNNYSKDTFLQLRLETFIKDILNAYRKWRNDMNDNLFVDKNEKEMIRYATASLSGFKFNVIH